MKLIFTMLSISLFYSLSMHPVDSIITFFVQKYPYFKIEEHKKFDPVKYSKQLKQPSFFYQTMTNIAKFDSAVPGIMCLYCGNIAISDKNGQLIFTRNQQTSNLYILVTTGIQPAYIIGPDTIHNWMIDPKQSSELYFVQFKQDDKLELYYFNISKIALPKNNNIPLNTILLISNPKDIFIPTGATVTEFSQNLILPTIYIKKDFCFINNSLYTLAIKQYFRQTDQESQLENLTISQIEQ